MIHQSLPANKASTLSFTGLTTWFLCAIFFMYEFLIRTVIGTFEHGITQDLNITIVQFSILSSSAYLMVYGLMQLPVGNLCDKYGIKLNLSFASLLCALSIMGFSLCHNFYSALIFRLLMGLGSSFGFVCLLLAVYEHLPKRYSGLFIGISQFIGTMGPLIAAGPLNALSNSSHTNWRSLFMVLGFLGLIIFILIQSVFKKHLPSQTVKQKTPHDFSKRVRGLLQHSQVWLIALFSGSVYFTIEYLSENSGKTYLMLHGYSSNISSYLISIAWAGYAIGCPLLGFTSDITLKRKPMMILASILCLVAVVLIVYFPINMNILVISFLMLGFGASGQNIGFAIMAEQCSNQNLALGLSFNNAIIFLIGSINAPLISWTLTLLSPTQTPNIIDYHLAFLIIVSILTLSAFISSRYIKETFCKNTKV